jgi:hypothetical protein
MKNKTDRSVLMGLIFNNMVSPKKCVSIELDATTILVSLAMESELFRCLNNWKGYKTIIP